MRSNGSRPGLQLRDEASLTPLINWRYEEIHGWIIGTRSFSVKVIGSTDHDTPNDAGNWKSVGGSGNIQCAHGEVVYLQSAVLGGQVRLKRTRPEEDDEAEEQEGTISLIPQGVGHRYVSRT